MGARKKKLKRSVRSAMHKVPKDAKLKKPLSGYMLWFKGARSTIKGKNIAEVSEKGGRACPLRKRSLLRIRHWRLRKRTMPMSPPARVQVHSKLTKMLSRRQGPR